VKSGGIQEDRHNGGVRGLEITELDIAALPAATREALAGIDRLLIHRTPLVTRFRGVTSRDGLLVHGESGWGEAAPFWDYGPLESSRWLRSALEAATTPPPAPLRREVPVNVTIPVSEPEEAARRVRASGGCRTAKVKVADPGQPLSADIERVQAVADALAEEVGGGGARLRVDANAAWTPDQAIQAVAELDRAAAAVGGLEYVEQPCPDLEGMAAVRRAVGVPIAADESIRRADDPLAAVDAVAQSEAADVAVVKVAPLGGLRRALEVASRTGLEIVVSSAIETSVGLDLGVRAAACLPALPHACGLATAQLLVQDVAARPLAPVGGAIPLPGLPTAPDPEAVSAASEVPGGLVARWRRRLDLMCQAMTALPGPERGGLR
jgi:O-succinylbenzoate synthase